MNGKKPQSQESLTEQLGKLVVIAANEGLYDAGDFILNVMKGQVKAAVDDTPCPSCGTRCNDHAKHCAY